MPVLCDFKTEVVTMPTDNSAAGPTKLLNDRLSLHLSSSDKGLLDTEVEKMSHESCFTQKNGLGFFSFDLTMALKSQMWQSTVQCYCESHYLSNLSVTHLDLKFCHSI